MARSSAQHDGHRRLYGRPAEGARRRTWRTEVRRADRAGVAPRRDWRSRRACICQRVHRRQYELASCGVRCTQTTSHAAAMPKFATTPRRIRPTMTVLPESAVCTSYSTSRSSPSHPARRSFVTTRKTTRVSLAAGGSNKFLSRNCITTIMPNRLAQETSPYLLQHRDNPVDWYPWGDEAIRKGAPRRQADFSLDRLLGLSLVPRDGARELRERSDRARAERELRADQGRSRGAARPRPDLHERRADAHRPRRLADERVSDARAEAVLRRHVLAAAQLARHAGLRSDSRGGARCLEESPRAGAHGRPSR